MNMLSYAGTLLNINVRGQSQGHKTGFLDILALRNRTILLLAAAGQAELCQYTIGQC